MSRHEQIIAATIGAVVTGIFGVVIALISSSSGPFSGNAPAAGAPSPAPAVSSPTASGAGARSTSPSPGQPPATEAGQYLAGLTPVSNSGIVETGNATVNGRNYLNSVILDMALGGSYSVSYNIERQWRTLKAAVGLRDDSPQNEKYEFQVFADGHPIYSHLLTLGQSQNITLNITGVLRLELRATLSSSDFFGEAYGVWGNVSLAK